MTEAYAALRRAEMADGEGLESARAEIDQLETLAGENVIVFRFRRLTRQGWERLVEAHPPSAAQIAKAEADKSNPFGARVVWNQDTFDPALIAAVCIDPALTVDEAKEMLHGLNEDGDPLMSAVEYRQLVNAAAAAATSVASLPSELRLP